MDGSISGFMETAPLSNERTKKEKMYMKKEMAHRDNNTVRENENKEKKDLKDFNTFIVHKLIIIIPKHMYLLLIICVPIV